MFLVFYPEFKYRERNKRDVSGSRDEESSVGVPVEVRFNALGRQFHFELEAASQPFTDMSHVLIRRWVYYRLCDVHTACITGSVCLIKVSYTGKLELSSCGY